MRWIIWIALLTLAVACAPPPEPVPAPLAPPPPAASEVLAPQAAALPGASVTQDGGLAIAYPGDSLFAPGAAIPAAGGLERLDPLARFLGDHRGNRWQVTVRAQSAFGKDYAAQLAAARGDLLQRFFRNRGVAMDQFDWISEAGDGPALELRLL